jgi:hypothetical protein
LILLWTLINAKLKYTETGHEHAWGDEKSGQNFGWKVHSRRPRRRWKDIIEMGLTEIEFLCMK